MLTVKHKTDILLKEKNTNYYELSKLINYDAGYLCNIFKGKNPFPEKLIKKLLPILEVSKEEFESWILSDKYPKEILKNAIQIKKDFPYKRKSILTTNIDAILKEKNISRTNFSKQIKYSQSALNATIIGKRGMSKSLLEKISQAFEIPQDEILSWIVADKYKLDVLEQAFII
jgi:predicted transcriptional regulator